MTSTPHIHLGFECQTGLQVELPLHHIVVTGLTQMSGKTTTLEALVSRSGCRAIVFSTKRGERDFPTAHEIRPFFRERVDWQYVQSLLEATMSEKLKFHRSELIKVSHGAKTLDDVHHNIKAKMEKAGGIILSICTELDAFFKIVIPEIRRANLSPTLELEDGLNIMQLGHLKTEVQSLVIQSVVDEIQNKHYTRTITVIPECWKFIPQGRGNPVKSSVQSLIRQGAVLGNFVWFDSQDIAGVDKESLKSVDVWLLGRQREANEIKRMIDQIPVRPKPKPEMIAQLELGQFVACFGSEVKKVYVQPSWMSWGTAQSIATGQVPMSKAMEKVKKPETASAVIRPDIEVCPICHQTSADFIGTLSFHEHIKSHQEIEHMGRIEELEQQVADLQHQLVEERMKQKKGSAIGRTLSTGTYYPMPEIAQVITSAGPITEMRDVLPTPPMSDKPSISGPGGIDDIVDAVLDRVKKLPEVLRVRFAEQRIEIDYEPVTITVEGDTFKGRVARLIKSGFFDEPRTNGDITAMLNKTGKAVHPSNVSRDMKYFVEAEFLEWADSSHYQSTFSAKNRLTMKAGD